MGSGLPRFPQNYTCSVVLRILTEVIEISSTGLSPSLASFPKTVPLSQSFVTSRWILTSTCKSFNTPATARQCCNIDRGLGFSAFAHRYSQNQFLSLFLRVIRCFSSPGIAPLRVVRVYLTGFSHSEINGSMLVYSSPLLIAANHVLLRLLVPWHPPYALKYLTYRDWETDRKSTRLNSSHSGEARMPSSA